MKEEDVACSLCASAARVLPYKVLKVTQENVAYGWNVQLHRLLRIAC